jgi:4-alpha-glucanotransferase
MQYDGFYLPLGSIKTKSSQGIGGFLDLLPFIDFTKTCKFNFIQVLPLNDSGLDPSPYNIISNLAFNPIYLSLDPTRLLPEELLEFQTLNSLHRIDYYKVLKLKLKILKRIYLSLPPTELSKVVDFTHLYPDLIFYSVFKYLKSALANDEFETNKGNFSSKEFVETLFEKEKKECLFFVYLQKLCHEQLAIVHRHAENQNINLLCDLPILVSPDSVEVLQYPPFFHEKLVAGTPPDQFARDGQYWGFPLYNWEEIIASDYLLWKRRFAIMDQFFSHFRIDHILGFFRLFGIPKNSSPKKGHYYPHDEKLALEQGENHLKSILKHTSMTPIGEDLGTKFVGVDQVLKKLKIGQTKVIRFEKEQDHFISFHNYPKNCIVSLSNHDTSLFWEWWEKNPSDHKNFCHLFGLQEEKFSPTFQHKILKKFHQLPCLYRVNLIQEYLYLDQNYVPKSPDEDRINLPGAISAMNWTYRMQKPIEELILNTTWISMIQSFVT